MGSYVPNTSNRVLGILVGRGWVGRCRRRRPTRTETETETETTETETETETNFLAPGAPQTNAPRDDICRSGLSANHPHSDKPNLVADTKFSMLLSTVCEINRNP